MVALLTPLLVDALSREYVLHQVFLTCVFQTSVKFVKEFVKELLSVTLLASVCGLAIILLERETEFCGVDKGTLSHLKLSKEHLKLAKHVVINLALFVLLYVLRCIVLCLE